MQSLMSSIRKYMLFNKIYALMKLCHFDRSERSERSGEIWISHYVPRFFEFGCFAAFAQNDSFVCFSTGQERY
jgi:hypothetical protein